MFFKLINKEVIMKNNQEKAVMTAAEKLGEALVLNPDWEVKPCLLYTSPSPRDGLLSRMPSSA